MATALRAATWLWYRPRSSGGASTPMMVMTPTISPPAPRPWSARNATSAPIDVATPHSAEPTRKITIAEANSDLRPYRSPSLPQTGVETVDVSRYAATTQDRCPNPPRSATMAGSAVLTISASSIASSIASRRPGRTVRIADFSATGVAMAIEQLLSGSDGR